MRERQCGMLNGEWGDAPSGSRRAQSSPFPIPHSTLFNRKAVTLVELLITMVILAILAAAILGTASAAMEAGRRARTQTMITKINGLLMERWASYETRRVDINTALISTANTSIADPKARGQAIADLRLLGIRELMKFEMPDRWSDILNAPINPTNPLATRPLAATILGEKPIPNSPPYSVSPPLRQQFYQRFQNLSTDDIDVVQSNQGAECLYMIVMFATGDGEARTLFNSQEIGDTDEDGAPEFLDGWGKPIQFIRWPAGFVSESGVMSGDASADHDPFDVYRRDLPTITARPYQNAFGPAVKFAFDQMDLRHSRNIAAYRLTPLIYSIGPDEDADVTMSVGATTELDPYLNKYGLDEDLQLGLVGDLEDDGEGWHDNIHNHVSN